MTKIISISVTDEDMDWLDKNPTVDRSKIFRQKISEMKKSNIESKPVILLVSSIIGILLGVTLVLLSFVPVGLSEIRLFYPILGIILTIFSLIVYYKK